MMMIKGFGSNAGQLQSRNLVQVWVQGLTSETCLYVNAYTVPIISSPLQNQAVKFTATTYQYLNGLSLADSNSSNENESQLQVDFLIGTDYYWHFWGRVVLQDYTQRSAGFFLDRYKGLQILDPRKSTSQTHMLSEWKQGCSKNNFRKIRHWMRNCPNSGNSNRVESCQKKDPYMRSSTTASSTRMVDTK